MTTHVALVRSTPSGHIAPAALNGVIIVGNPTELRAQFGTTGRLFTVEPKRDHVFGKPTMSFAEWLVG